MSSFRPLFTIAILGAVGVYLYIKINEGPAKPRGYSTAANQMQEGVPPLAATGGGATLAQDNAAPAWPPASRPLQTPRRLYRRSVLPLKPQTMRLSCLPRMRRPIRMQARTACPRCRRFLNCRSCRRRPTSRPRRHRAASATPSEEPKNETGPQFGEPASPALGANNLPQASAASNALPSVEAPRMKVEPPPSAYGCPADGRPLRRCQSGGECYATSQFWITAGSRSGQPVTRCARPQRLHRLFHNKKIGMALERAQPCSHRQLQRPILCQ